MKVIAQKLEVILVALFVLAISFLSNISPFFGASYTLVATLQLMLPGFSPFDLLLVVSTSALGAILAKTVIYHGAFGFRRLLVQNENAQLIGMNASRMVFWLILFLTVLAPCPFS